MLTKPIMRNGIKSAARTLSLLSLIVCAMSAAASAQTAEAPPLKLLSPGGQVEITFALGEDGAPVYSVAYRGQAIIAPSALGLEFRRGGLLSKGLRFAGALSLHDVPFALHIYPHGRHGLGLAQDDPTVRSWTGLCAAWLADRSIG